MEEARAAPRRIRTGCTVPRVFPVFLEAGQLNRRDERRLAFRSETIGFNLNP
jgi:hypothetical protein